MGTFLLLIGCAQPVGDTAVIVREPGKITLFASIMGETVNACSVFENGTVVGDCAAPIPFEEATHWLHIGDPNVGTSDDGYPLLLTEDNGLWVVDDIEATVMPNSNASQVCAANQFAQGTWECSGSDLTTSERGAVTYREGNLIQLPSLGMGLTVEGRKLSGTFGDSTVNGTFTDHRTITLTVRNTHVATRTCVAVEE